MISSCTISLPDLYLKSGQKHPDFEWSSLQTVGKIALANAKARQFENRTIWNPTFKKSGFQMFPDFEWSDIRCPLYWITEKALTHLNSFSSSLSASLSSSRSCLELGRQGPNNRTWDFSIRVFWCRVNLGPIPWPGLQPISLRSLTPVEKKDVVRPFCLVESCTLAAEMRVRSLFTSLTFCTIIFSCPLILKERIYTVPFTCVSLIEIPATINL